VTARKDKSEKDEKTAGTDESKTTATTKEVEDNEVPTSPEERGETDAKAAASGNSVGAVKDGDVGGEDEVVEEVDTFSDGSVDGALGTVPERNAKGDEYDSPWVYLTADHALVRTSDSDDPAKDWTAQHAGGERKDEDGNDLDPVALVAVQGVPGQTFRATELPNVDVMEEAGIDSQQWLAGLPVRADVPDEAPRRGIPA
jgi:hypothetical protein